MINLEQMIAMKLSRGMIPAFNKNARPCRANREHLRGSEKSVAGPSIISMDQARVILADAGWSDVRFLAFCHGSILVAWSETRLIRIALNEDELDQLLELLTRNDRARVARSTIANGSSRSRAE